MRQKLIITFPQVQSAGLEDHPSLCGFSNHGTSIRPLRIGLVRPVFQMAVNLTTFFKRDDPSSIVEGVVSSDLTDLRDRKDSALNASEKKTPP